MERVPRLELRHSLAREEQERDISSLREQRPETPHVLNCSPLSDVHSEGPRHQGRCSSQPGLTPPAFCNPLPPAGLPAPTPVLAPAWDGALLGSSIRPARLVLGSWEEPLEPPSGLSQTQTLPGAEELALGEETGEGWATGG